jgi:hypothetical protein
LIDPVNPTTSEDKATNGKNSKLSIISQKELVVKNKSILILEKYTNKITN